jgi:hypothetical protein
MIVVDDPGGVGFRIEHLYAFLSIDETDDDEGVCAFHGGQGWMPMVAADEERLDDYKRIAKRIASETGRPVKLVRFDQRVELEEIKP